MANRAQQDTFMDDSEETCPLCVEEFDLSDKCFKPCPCGYQVCQFCYNNIKNNMNGLCPACRRVYDEKNVEYKIISPEEHKADAERQARRKALVKQKESEKKQVETLSRKHLVGKRVVQKDLVYVSGLNRSNVGEDELMRTMRNDDYFGKYGPIRKVVASKAREGPGGSNSIALYVTFEHAEDAQKCIAAVNGSVNAGRTLRAQLGTTKYCSKYLRNEQCNNPNCMFLHEIAEDSDSYTRQELSSLNAGSTQRPNQSLSSLSEPPQAQPIPQQVSQIASTVAQVMARQGSRDEAMSRSDSGDGSALPSTASWATKNSQIESRRSSKPASMSAPSPVIANASTASKAPVNDSNFSIQQPLQGKGRNASSAQQGATQMTSGKDESVLPESTTPTQGLLSDLDLLRPRSLREDHPFHTIMERASKLEGFVFDRSRLSPDLMREIDSMPPLYDANAGIRMLRAQKRQEDERRRVEEDRTTSARALSSNNDDEELRTGGSFQLGGEPEEEHDRISRSGQSASDARGAIQPPFPIIPGRESPSSVYPSQNALQGQFPLPQQTSSTRPVNSASLHQHQQSNPFQNSNFGTATGHARHASRYNFAESSTSQTTTVNPSSNAHMFSQQGSAMDSMPLKPPQAQATTQNQHYLSNVQGPPPGFKTNGTPPISGGGMFGQGHGFASAMGGSSTLGQVGGNNKNTSEELMREILSGRGSVSSPGNNFGKREFTFPSTSQPSAASFSRAAPTPSLQTPFQGTHLGSVSHYQDQVLQKQKKKGRKHRHANTSSSGGGGLVDLADPSILQARMQHGSVGQGSYGFGQESRVLSQLREPPYPDLQPIGSIPSLRRNIEPIGVPATAPEPKGLARFGPGATGSANIQSQTKDPTEPVPPQPQDFPPLAAPAEQNITSNAKPTATTGSASKFKPAIPALGKATARDAGARKNVPAAQITQKKKDLAKIVSDTDGPTGSTAKAAEKTDTTSKSKATTIKGEPSTRSEVATNSTKNGRQAPVSGRKKAPGVLDTSATKDVAKQTSSASVTGPAKATESSNKASTGIPAKSQPATPTRSAPQSAPSSAARNQTRTLRLADMPRMDPPMKSVSPAIADIATVSSGAMSRRSSLISALPPGTPISERVSDTVSLPSTALSRASSPGPGGKVGPVAVRPISKNQRKKERQAHAKHNESELKAENPEVEVVKEEKDDVVQAPIQGRKKKTKKINAAATTTSTPAVTRPSSPSLPPTEEVPEVPPIAAVEIPKSASSTAATDTEQLRPAAAPEIYTASETRATSLLKSVENSSTILAKILKPLPFSGRNFKFTHDELLTGKVRTMSPSDISEAQREDHRQGKSVIVQLKAHDGDLAGQCVVLLPDGREIWESSQAMAERYLQTYEGLRNKDDHAVFTPDPKKLPGRAELERWVPRVKNSIITSATSGGENTRKSSTSTRISAGNTTFTYDEEVSPTSSLEDFPVIPRWIADQDPTSISTISPPANANSADKFVLNAEPSTPEYTSFHRGLSFVAPLDSANAIAKASAARVNNAVGSSGLRGTKPDELKRELEVMEKTLEIRRKEELLAGKMLGASIKKNRKAWGV